MTERRIAGLASEVLVLGAIGEGDSSGEVWLLEPQPEAPLGSRIGWAGPPYLLAS